MNSYPKGGNTRLLANVSISTYSKVSAADENVMKLKKKLLEGYKRGMKT